MFCYQCEQAVKGEACTVSGVCGKDPIVAALQDLLIENLTGIAFYAHKLHGLGMATPEADVALIEGLFTTVTNVNFDAERMRLIILKSQQIKEDVRTAYIAATGAEAESVPGGALLVPADTVEGMLKQAAKFVLTLARRNDDVLQPPTMRFQRDHHILVKRATRRQRHRDTVIRRQCWRRRWRGGSGSGNRRMRRCRDRHGRMCRRRSRDKCHLAGLR